MFLSLGQNIWDKLIIRKDFFWPGVSVWVSPWLFGPLLWVCGGAVCHGGERIKEEVYIPHGGWGTEKERRGGRGWSPNIPFKSMLQWPDFLPLGPITWSFHHLPVRSQAGNQTFSTWAFGRHLRSKPLFCSVLLCSALLSSPFFSFPVFLFSLSLSLLISLLPVSLLPFLPPFILSALPSGGGSSKWQMPELKQKV